MAKTAQKKSPKKAATKKSSPKKAASGKPKRISSFIQFCNENRAKVIKDNNFQPRQIGDIGKALGAMWKKMSDSQKQAYADKAAKASN